jgi:uncharacterized YigZ family protein
MNYFTIVREVENIYVEKKSKFIAYMFPIKDEYDFKEALNDIKKVHPKANHHCWAYVLGEKCEIEKCSDDGEPTGAAGLPILGQLKSKELTYCACVVVRFFGGIKLGKGGMIRAYKEAAKQSIECANIIQKEICIEYMLEVEYPYMNRVMQIIKRNEIKIGYSDISTNCKFYLQIPIKLEKEIIGILSKVKSVSINIMK